MGTSVTPYAQTRRLLRLETALGSDALVAATVSGEEAMSEGFSYSLDCFSDSVHEIPPEKLVGTAVSFQVYQEDETPRRFHGYVAEITALGRHYAGQRSNYRLSVVPWLWFLGKQADCRVFQEMTVEEVLKELFAPLGDKARFSFKLTKAHPRHRFLVQYNETSLNFLYRLLRREGIAFYIGHAEGGHTVHFVDDANSLPTLAPDTLMLQSGQAGDHLTGWEHSNGFVTGNYAERSYNYKDPTKVQAAETRVGGGVARIPGVLELEQYQYSEAYETATEGKADVQWRREQGVERHGVVTGAAAYRHLVAGHHFKVEQVPAGDWPDHGKEFTLVRVSLRASNDGGVPFSASFEAIAKGELAYAREGQTPIIPGLQTAVVTGPKGEEIYTDRLGRIKVQFHWDREGRQDEQTTCWLRVMQSFAGPGFGAHFTPRIGQEVVVAFENGNPDRPFVLGALYHPEHAPPYAGEPTQSGIKTRSTKQGGAANANEIRFDDKQGAEELYVQAERDLEVYVKHDETRTVDNDRSTEVRRDERHSVGNNLALQVKNNETHTVDNNLELGVKNNAEIKVGKKLRIHAGTEIELVVGGTAIKLTKSKLEIGSTVVDIDGKRVEIN